MQKQAPSFGRILVAAGFTLSCFALALYLWIAFGGPIPLKPESYRITAYFPEATQLAVESDVRIGGVSVGKVKSLDLADPKYRVNGNDTTEAVIEIEPEFAPITEDARAILRSKTLLGETFVELTSGTEEGQKAAPVSLGAAANVSDAEAEEVEPLEEGGTLGVSQTQDATQIDEIFNALDNETRESFQRWMANSATAVEARGLDLNDAFGNLGPFLTDAAELTEILRQQRAQLKGLVRDTGEVFAALTERDQELAGVIVNSNDTFDALASQDAALAETFQIFPTFQRESRLTFERLDDFQANTRPLVRDLIPVARDISPTLRSLRELSPPLRSVFSDLDRLIKVSEDGLPALEEFLHGVGPLLDELDPFLANFNPVLRYLEYQKATVADFLAAISAALSNAICTDDKPEAGCQDAGVPAARHYLRQMSYTSAETLGIHPQRLDTNRGAGYLDNMGLTSYLSASSGIFENYDCKNLDYGGSTPPDEDEIELGENPPPDVNDGNPPDVDFAPCVVDESFPPEFGSNRFPTLFSDP